ncbi:MAG: hypothetical protein C4293_09900 [Nitrospiraceae bacterium]
MSVVEPGIAVGQGIWGMRKALLWAGAVLGAVILIIVLVLAFIDEPLRAYAERQLNRRVEGYTFRIGKLDFHPVKLGVELKDITVVQKKHPDPPVAQLAKWRACLQWGALLSGRIVSDHEIERPVLRITRPQAKEEAEDEKPAAQKSWQEDVLALYPVTVNKFEIAAGDVTYIDHPKARPLHVGHLNFHATNIRNVKSEPNAYPSDVRLEATLFGSGTVTVDGRLFLRAVSRRPRGFRGEPGLAGCPGRDLGPVPHPAPKRPTVRHRSHGIFASD